MKIKLLLGILPDTNKYEEGRNALFDEYKKYIEYEKSDELKNYLALKEEVHSDDFKNKVSAIKAQKFQDTPEFQKEKEYKELKNAPDIKLYYKFKDSGDPEWIISYEESQDYKEMLKLEKLVSSDKFNEVKQNMLRPGKERYKETESYMKFQAYMELKNDNEVKNYLKFKKNKSFEIFNRYHDSKEWKDFIKLEDHINSSEFQTQKAKLTKKEYAESDLKQTMDEYIRLKKSHDYKMYRKVSQLPEANDYLKLEGSEKTQNYFDLKEIIESDTFKQERTKIEKSTFKYTTEYEKEQQLKSLKKSTDFKKYSKIKNSNSYKNYIDLDKSERIKHFEELGKYLETEEFLNVKNYMLLKPNEKYQRSEEYQKEQAYKELNNSENIIWFYHVGKKDKFKSIKNLELTFEEDFKDNKLNTKKWLTRYFWGDVLLKESFSVFGDKHFITDGKNLEIQNSVLSIVTKKEEIEGKAWSKKYGFFNKTFEYTSGLINTGNSFRQKYGLFEAKIKINPTFPVSHAFWMIADKALPHIDIVKYDKIIMMNNFWMNGQDKVRKNVSRLGASKFTSGYFIYSLEWQEGSLTWKINGEVVATRKTGIPNEPMYINFSSGIYKDKDPLTIPATMEIDWVHCYQFKESS